MKGFVVAATYLLSVGLSARAFAQVEVRHGGTEKIASESQRKSATEVRRTQRTPYEISVSRCLGASVVLCLALGTPALGQPPPGRGDHLRIVQNLNRVPTHILAGAPGA